MRPEVLGSKSKCPTKIEEFNLSYKKVKLTHNQGANRTPHSTIATNNLSFQRQSSIKKRVYGGITNNSQVKE